MECSNSSTCLELALEGERLCKAGDFNGGVAFFEAAIQSGTSDLKTLSAVYSQLGNAYFYICNYTKAMEYHKLDLTVARAIGDRLGEAKASGNLGNTLKMMGKFDEAVLCCKRHLEISQAMGDKVGEGRALYNLGNVYHAKGKHTARIGQQDPGEFPEEVKECLLKAVDYYQDNLRLMTELGDRSAQGRACGNLGNTHYLLGNFSQAVSFHQERLKLAKEFGDKAAERRAYSNLGNAHIFLGEFEIAADFYKRTLSLSEDLGDRAVEAQACYSLGNTYTLLREYPVAVQYHLRHLKIAQELKDKVGESRAFWSLGNAYSAIGNHEKALQCANKHLLLSKEIGDSSGQVTAQISISDLQNILGIQSVQSTPTSEKAFPGSDVTPVREHSSRMRRSSMEKMDLLKMTPESSNERQDLEMASSENKENVDVHNSVRSYGSKTNEDRNSTKSPEKNNEEEMFFDLVTRFQSKRMDDQRCSVSLVDEAGSNEAIQSCSSHSPVQLVEQPTHFYSSPGKQDNPKNSDELFEMIVGMQSRRMDEQRASLPGLPNLNHISQLSNVDALPPAPHHHHRHVLHRMSVDTSTLPDDDFFEMLMRCQATRIEDQRSSMPNLSLSQNHMDGPVVVPHGSTVPDDDFFSLILRFQGGRIEDQRSSLPNKPVTLDRNSAAAHKASSLKSSLANRGTRSSSSKH